MWMIRSGMICLTLLAMLLATIAPVLAQKPSPLTKADILARLEAAQRREILQADIAGEINARGIDFSLSDAVLTELRKAGAKTVIIDALLRAIAQRNAPAGPENRDDGEPVTTIGEDRADDEAARLPFIEQVRR